MDLVKAAAAGGFTVMAMVASVASGGSSRAGSLPAFTAEELAAARIQARIDAAFRSSEPAQNFEVTGPLFPPAARVPVLPARRVSRDSWPALAAPARIWSDYIDEASRRFGVPAEWVRGVMMQESGGRTHLNGRPITSPAGAMGLMQVMPATFAEMSARHGLGSDPYEPRANILAGTAYLRAMYDRYGPMHFLAAYNAGPARVDAFLRSGRTLPAETRQYVDALLPRLGSDVGLAVGPARNGKQDLTSLEAIRAITAAPSRPSPEPPTRSAAASLFASSTAHSPAPARDGGSQASDSLFVPIGAVDRRREASTAGSSED